MELIVDEKAARYSRGKAIGGGTFGDVSIGYDRVLGREVAIKHVRIMSRECDGIPKAVFRELETLKQLKGCQGVVEILDYYPEDTHLCLVFEFLPMSVEDIISTSSSYLPISDVKSFGFMLFQALNHCHSLRIIHRDVKPANILVTRSGTLKLGDFGLARVYDPASSASLSHQVSTRWYRAPELLFASRHYTPAVDVWSAAVVVAELFTLSPLFPGSNDIDQLYRVFQIMGSPSTDVWQGVDRLPDFDKISFPNMKPVDLSLLMAHARPDDVEFLRTMLCLDPLKRHTASRIISDEYFKRSPPPSNHSELARRYCADYGAGRGGTSARSASDSVSATASKSKNVKMDRDKAAEYIDSFLIS
jgi:serine/threonine protein kinase